jgi:hypothetical protein
MMARNVLFVTDSDSNVKFATHFGRHLEKAGLENKTVFVGQDYPSLGQAANAVAAGSKVEVVPTFASLFAGKDLLRYDVILVLITGRLIKEFCANLNLLALTYGVPKPVTVGGFIGEWISANGQVEERGALDIFVVNRADELEKFRAICARASHGKTFVSLPYGFLVRHDFAKPLAPSFDYDMSKTIVFADQVQVPRSSAERAFLYENLEAIARKAPNLKLYFCARETEGGATKHRSLGGISEHLSGESLAALPNVIVEHGTFQKRLAEADLVLSVSSTAGVEALINGVPALFLRGFASSGAEKFSHTGLLIDVFELKSPKTFTLDPAFYADISRTDVWDEFAELIRSQPSCGVNAQPARRAVRTSLIASPSVANQYEDVVFSVLGLDGADELDAPIPTQPVDLASAAAAARTLPPTFAANLVVSPTPRLPSPHPEPSIATTTVEGYVARAEIPLKGVRELTVHVPVSFERDDTFDLSGAVYGEPFTVTVGKAGTTVAFSDPTAIQAAKLVYKSGAERTTAFRVRSFVPLDVDTARVSRNVGSIPPAWMAYQPNFILRRLGTIAPALVPSPITLPAHSRAGAFSVLRFEREQFGYVGRLLTWTDTDGRTLEVEALTGQRLGLSLSSGNGVVRKEVSCSTLAITMVVIATPGMTIVMMNENLLVFETAFRPASLVVDPAVEGGLALSLFINYAADITLNQANGLVEQLLLKFFSAPSFAKKHRAIPEFRSVIEERLGGKKLAPAKKAAEPAKDAAKKPGLNGAAAPAATADQKPVVAGTTPAPAKSAAAKAPAKTDAKPAAKPLASKPVAAAPKPAAKKPAPKPASIAAPGNELARVMEPYLDLVTSQDLTEAAAISKQSKSLLLFSERFLRSGDHGKALAVSAIAADRTPTSKAHLMICAEALAALGAADRAEKFLRQAETLAPGDAGIQLRAAKIRGQTLPGSGGSGVAGFFKRAFGGR